MYCRFSQPPPCLRKVGFSKPALLIGSAQPKLGSTLSVLCPGQICHQLLICDAHAMNSGLAFETRRKIDVLSISRPNKRPAHNPLAQLYPTKPQCSVRPATTAGTTYIFANRLMESFQDTRKGGCLNFGYASLLHFIARPSWRPLP